MKPSIDKAYGVLLGQAIGDALGLPAEHKSSEWCAERYKTGGPYDYERVERPSRGEVFEAGDWSDDTDQAIILVDSWVEHGEVNPQDVARRLLEWAKTQKGMGTHTSKVLSHDLFALNPGEAAYQVWNVGGRTAEPNGAVMRAAVCGLFGASFEETWDIAKRYAQITHAAPRCQISAAMVAGLVYLLSRGASPDFAISAVYDKQTADPIGGFSFPEEHYLWDGATQGYTVKPVQAAIRALRMYHNLHPQTADDQAAVTQCLLGWQIREGGDTDTNAAVVGAVLGAVVGAAGWKAHLVERLRNLAALYDRAFALCPEDRP